MNFFGHAAMAVERRADPAFALGAMVPDFCAMTRAHVVHVRDASVAAGIEHHHATDAAFHAAPTFVALCHGAIETLLAQGVGRGTARAVAHVGTELLLDGVAFRDHAVRRVYPLALDYARDSDEAGGFAFRDGTEHARFTALHRRLASFGLAPGADDPDSVAERLRVALAHRPRLAMTGGDLPTIRTFCAGHRGRVAASAAVLLGEVRAALAA